MLLLLLFHCHKVFRGILLLAWNFWQRSGMKLKWLILFDIRVGKDVVAPMIVITAAHFVVIFGRFVAPAALSTGRRQVGQRGEQLLVLGGGVERHLQLGAAADLRRGRKDERTRRQGTRNGEGGEGLLLVVVVVGGGHGSRLRTARLVQLVQVLWVELLLLLVVHQPRGTSTTASSMMVVVLLRALSTHFQWEKEGRRGSHVMN